LPERPGARLALIVFAVAAVAGVAFLVWRASADERTIAFRIGALPRGPAAVLAPGGSVCQTPIDVQEETNAVSVPIGTSGRPGAPLTISVTDLRGRPLARGGVRRGYSDGSLQTARFRRIRPGGTVSLCIRNDGREPVYPLGEDVVIDSGIVQAGRKSTMDISLTFLRPHRHSVLDLVPAMFRHAAVFRFGWVGAWTYWVLAALAVLAVPVLCAYALARAAREDDA
jgi:hypothetical protein